MGQKVNPHGRDLIVEDFKIRGYLKKTLYSAGVPTIEIERDSSKVRIYIHCARPGVVIGKGGQEIERLRQEVEKLIGKPVALSIVEIRTPDTNAQLVAENIAQQLEKRIGFRRAMKNAMGRAMRMGAARPITREPSPCRPSVPTSTTALPRPTRPTAASASRSGSTKARSSPRPCAQPRARWIFRSRQASAAAETTAVRAIAVRADSTVTAARAASAVRATAADLRVRAATTADPARLLP